MAAKKLSAYQKYLNRRERMIKKGYFVTEAMDERSFDESVELAKSEIEQGSLKTRRSAEQYAIEEGDRYFTKKQAKALKKGINDMLRDKKFLNEDGIKDMLRDKKILGEDGKIKEVNVDFIYRMESRKLIDKFMKWKGDKTLVGGHYE